MCVFGGRSAYARELNTLQHRATSPSGGRARDPPLLLATSLSQLSRPIPSGHHISMAVRRRSHYIIAVIIIGSKPCLLAMNRRLVLWSQNNSNSSSRDINNSSNNNNDSTRKGSHGSLLTDTVSTRIATRKKGPTVHC